jgi:hypothetical protein
VEARRATAEDTDELVRLRQVVYDALAGRPAGLSGYSGGRR